MELAALIPFAFALFFFQCCCFAFFFGLGCPVARNQGTTEDEVDRLGFGLAPRGSAASAALLRSAAPLRAPQLAQAALQALRGGVGGKETPGPLSQHSPIL